MDPILYWNDVAGEANRSAHTDQTDAGSRGPCGSSRAYAIVHLAMHDAYFGCQPAPPYPSYLTGLAPAPAGADADCAVAAAAHATLSALYPAQKAYFDARHAAAGLVAGKPGAVEGHVYGGQVAAAVLAARAADPGLGDDGHASSILPGRHRHDPDAPVAEHGYHAPHYGAAATCFTAQRHRLAPYPGLPTAEYRRAVEEVRAKGIAPQLMGTLPPGSIGRTPTETVIGLFWGYDGAKGLGTPPRLYNQIVRVVAAARGNSVEQNARLFALVNAAMGDAGILAWDDKYHYDLWRPVIGIREYDPSTGPAATGGDLLAAEADPGWLPLGAPRTNEPGRKNFTPPFPAYPSGHATFGAAALQMVRRFYEPGCENGPDTLADGLSFVSEELDGINTDNAGTVRPRHARSFPGGLWQMIEENGRSRVYLGVHWVFDAFAVKADGSMDLDRNVGGVALGLGIADDITVNGLAQGNGAAPTPR